MHTGSKSVSSMTTTVAVMQKGMTSRKSFSTLMDLSRLLATNRHAPKGGVMLPTAMPMQNTTPRWIMLMPRAAAAGQTSGPTIRMIVPPSTNIPEIRTIRSMIRNRASLLLMVSVRKLMIWLVVPR